MNIAHPRKGRRATNVSLDASSVDEARQLGINLSQACELGLKQAISEARSVIWREENKAAIEAYNESIDRNGIPLEDLRIF